ncbi:MAG: HAD family hydrolase [Planctomycetes bacterium]|nr:HAD family hydrolase [Planctomycetota bacterium]
MITTVIFDLDDTLYDEIDYCKSGFTAVARYLSQTFPRKVTTDLAYTTLWEIFESGEHAQTFNHALSALGLEFDEKFIRGLILIYRKHIPKLHLPRESRQVLDNLKPNFTMAMLTDGYLPGQRLKIKALGIQSYFKHVVFTEQLGRQFWKPSPAGFEALAKVLDCPFESMVYVGDNAQKDFLAPNQLGMTSIQVVRDLGVHRESQDDPTAHPQFKLARLSELPPLLTELNTAQTCV